MEDVQLSLNTLLPGFETQAGMGNKCCDEKSVKLARGMPGQVDSRPNRIACIHFMAGEFIDIAEILYRARYRLWIEPTKIGTMLSVEVMDCCVYCSTEIFDQLTDAGFRLNLLDGIYRRKAAAQGRQEKED